MTVRILTGDCRDVLKTLPDGSVQCCVTSPPYYGLRDYGVDGQIGLERSMHDFIGELVAVFREVRRVLRDDGTLWLNIGDSYNAAGRSGHGTRVGYKQGTNRASADGADHCRPTDDSIKPKDLMLVPERLALALQDDGWYVRSRIIWHKLSAMPESVTDRPTKAHEHIWLLSKSERYFYDKDAASEPVSDDTIPRYLRGRSDEHKYADGGPGNQTIARGFGHMVGIGHNERERKAVPNGAVMRTVERRGTFRGGAYCNNSTFDNSAGGKCTEVGNVRVPAEGAMRNWRDVWPIGPEPFKEAHFATFPTEIPRRAILAGSRPGDTILDPFGGAGTTGLVADRLQRDAILIELNPQYAEMARRRIHGDAPLFADVDGA